MTSDQPLRVELKTLHLTEPFRIAHGVSTERQVLRLHWGDAVGEAPFVPYYGENPQETLRWVQGLAWSGSPVPEAGPRAGRLALDVLWHDAVGKQRGLPLWKLWELDATKLPPACRSFSIPTDLEAFAEKVRETHRQFRVLKLKLGSGNAEFDEAIAAKAREAAPQATIFADANGGWSVEVAAAIIPKLARYGLAFVEQPLHHSGGVAAWRELRQVMPHSPLPIYADESAQSSNDAHALSGLVDGVNVKLLKSGSLKEAREMIHTARVLKMRVLLGCMIESSIGVTAAAHLAPLADLVDLDGHLYVADDDYCGVKFGSAGEVVLPEGPGLGVAES
ncbi:L-alanine-DL-glutamate epimerase-like enolase superfamily enzyme [Roseimicrobium gellanilyticum]|uniref:L-alanine-DL-glutamate epimerase-like enolase superfamily enzyme n=1 Tax=Roseimicrobium gellanilyticum TaxID=748857 RepID=A0A366HVS5_9BACT|nr:enolase C-terminal domain-like protein [Roseimicrobium gellanilyticum]RBP47398.1 L-alanine-DL-glutamate epimerase-like enolase superfamily enzyme [Roseimicrobium gellanilyticum]